MKTMMLWFLTVLCLTACKPNPEQTNPSPAATPPTTVSTAVPNQSTTANTEPAASIAPDTNCALRLGFEAWEPYQFMSLDNKASGLDIELMQAIADEMDCQLLTTQGTWVDLMAQLKVGDVDMLLGASVTPAREEFAYFSKPYRKEQFVMFVRAAASLPETTLAEFLTAGKKIGIVSEYFYGTDFAELLADYKFKTQFIEASLSELNIARLLDEEIDGMIEDSFVARSMLRRKGLESQIARHAIELSSGDVFVMFSKKSVSAEQVSAFNDALTSIAKNGKYQQILDKYQQ